MQSESGKIQYHKDPLQITWHSVRQAVGHIANRLAAHNYKPQRILAVARGGMIPAVMLSHILDVREVGSVQVEAYDGRIKGAATKVITGFGQVEHYNKPDTLIVDDLWDTGETHEHLRRLFHQATFATLFYKDRGDESHRIVSFPGLAVPRDEWLQFPWEA